MSRVGGVHRVRRMACAAHAVRPVGAVQAEAIADAAMRLEHLPDVAALTRLLQ